MLKIFIEAVGFAAPGLPNWASAQEHLRNGEAVTPTPLDKYKPERLPANERRRATELVRLAFRVCDDAYANCTISPGDCATVFASSGGDYPIIDQICQSLTEPEKLVSPTQFHNSVHNSAAGYWSIAVESRHPSTSLSAFDCSFAEGLLEAALLAHALDTPCLFNCYDLVPPAPLFAKRPISMECGLAFVLTTQPGAHTLAALSLSLGANPETPCQAATIEALRHSNPAARALPLLEAIAKRQTQSIHIATKTGSLDIEVSPWN